MLMHKPLIIGLDVRVLKTAKTGIRSYLMELCKEFKNDFGVEAPLGVKIKLKLVCLHPLIFLSFYHLALIASQFYKNRVAPIIKSKDKAN